MPVLGIVVLSTLVFNTSKAKEIVKEVKDRVEDVKVPLSDLKNEKQELSNYPILQEDTSKNRRNNNQDANSPDLIFNEVEIMPVPSGGIKQFRRWISDNINIHRLQLMPV